MLEFLIAILNANVFFAGVGIYYCGAELKRLRVELQIQRRGKENDLKDSLKVNFN